MKQELIHEINHIGSQFKIVPVEKLEDLKKNVSELRKSASFTDITNLIVNDFYNFTIPDSDFTIRSIMIVARPCHLIPLYFHWKGKKIPVMNEPVITHKQIHTETYLNTYLNSKGFHVRETYSLPMKMLAVRSGLSQYGRNNVTYTPGLGSFVNLSAYFTDIPCEEYIWQDLNRMEQCDNCKACIRNCPTQAITEDVPMINVARCLTYLNEFIDLCDFPDWLTTSSHNCLHGCMKCQLNCPMNKQIHRESSGTVEFSEEEALLLMEGAEVTKLPESLLDKINRLDLADYLHLMPRNLQVLFDQFDSEKEKLIHS